MYDMDPLMDLIGSDMHNVNEEHLFINNHDGVNFDDYRDSDPYVIQRVSDEAAAAIDEFITAVGFAKPMWLDPHNEWMFPPGYIFCIEFAYEATRYPEEGKYGGWETFDLFARGIKGYGCINQFLRYVKERDRDIYDLGIQNAEQFAKDWEPGERGTKYRNIVQEGGEDETHRPSHLVNPIDWTHHIRHHIKVLIVKKMIAFINPNIITD